MALFDYRTKDEAQISFLVFEDLRFAQNGGHGPAVYRYDDLESALSKYRETPEHMTPALGMHLSERAELDLIQRREGEHVLVTDFRNFSHWRTNDEVLRAVDHLCETLNIQWQMDSRCMAGHATILIPLERGIEHIPDRVFSNKMLKPVDPRFWGDSPVSVTAINEAYVEGEGWMKQEEFLKQAEAFGYDSPHCLKVKWFNVNYIDDTGHTGQVDVPPLDMQILQERYRLCNANEHGIKTAIEQIAENVAELVVAAGPDRDHYTEQLKADFTQGRVASAVEALEAMRDYGDTDRNRSQARVMLARVKSLSMVLMKASLESRMSDASARAADKRKNGPGRNSAEHER